MGSFLLFAAVVAVCLLMLWASYKMEPHWVSKDGERMICYGQCLSRGGQTMGRWREMRINRVQPNMLEVRPRRGTLAVDTPGSRTAGAAVGGMLKRRAPKSSLWKVSGRTETPLRNRVMFVLDGNTDANLPDLIAIRLPKKSRAVSMLDEMSKTPTSSAPPNRESDRSAAQPDPG
jgi:hypothetical protein